MALLIVAFGTVCYEARLLSRQVDERQVLQGSIHRLEDQARRLQDEKTAMERSQTQANQKLATLQAEAATAGTSREVEIRSWLKRAYRLQELFTQKPDQAIPELQLLSQMDWLRLSHEAKLETKSDIRQAMAAIRSESTAKFAQLLSTVLRKYTEAHDGLLPTSAVELTPYFDPPVDPAILPRYEMLATGPVSSLPGGFYVIAESSPVDAEYDSRNYVGVPPYGMATGPWRTDDLWVARQDATLAFFKDNNGQKLANQDQIVPYIQSPIMQEIFQALANYRQAHPTNQWPTIAVDILPLLTSPEAKAKAEKFWPDNN